MKMFAVPLVATMVGVLANMAFAQSSTGSHSMSSAATGGMFGTKPAAPGTNSLGTALPSDIRRGRRLRGSIPAIDRENAKVDRRIGSICRGC